MNQQSYLIERLRRYYNDSDLAITLTRAVGGDIHESYVVKIKSASAAPKTVFLKLNRSDDSQVLAAESQALVFFQASAMAGSYPKPIMFDDSASGSKHAKSMLVMEYYDLASVNSDNASLLGKALARQHSIYGEKFGWECDNFIGMTPQYNQPNDNWIDFFAQQRLAPQLALAASRGLSQATVLSVQAVIENLGDYLGPVTTADVKPSLLHGDLWSGNLAVRNITGQPLLYDPAPYFGDAEVDIAMTKLFGRLSESFYTAYHDVHPVRDGQAERAKIYDLYHLLNHFNLFGIGYEVAVNTLLQKL